MRKTILITGASRGLGLILAQKLAQEGFKVYAGFNKKKPDINKENLFFLKLDVTNNQSCLHTFRKISLAEKRIDILINCAGISPSGPTLEASVDQFIHTLQVNTIGPFRVIKCFLPLIKKDGLIVNITSLNGFVSLPHSGIYSASKFGLEALGLALHNELKEIGIKVINIAPGTIYKDEDKGVYSVIRRKFPIINLIMPRTYKSEAAEKIIKIMKNNSASLRRLIGQDAYVMYILNKILPLSLYYRIINLIWQKRF